MTIWIDAQLSPSLALWINQSFQNITAQSIKAVGLRDANDKDIFDKARKENAVIMTKDDDFINLLERYGSPPQVIWIRCGNTSNKRMRELLEKRLQMAINLLGKGNSLVEITEI